MENKQLSLMDAVMSLGGRRKTSRAVATLEALGAMVNWGDLAVIVSVLDKTQTGKGGRPPIDFEIKLKMLFLQYAFNLSDEELEDQLIDRLSFQQFAGLGYDEEIPDFTTVWRFKEALIRQNLMDPIFESIVGRIEANGLLLKKGTIVDATIIKSGNRPLSRKKREELETEPSSQIDTDAQSTAKNAKSTLATKGISGLTPRARSFENRHLHRPMSMTRRNWKMC